MDNWEVKQLRLTIFPTEGEIDPNAIWENMVSEKPETINTITKLRQVTMQGTYQLGVFTIVLQQDRIHFTYEAALDPDELGVNLGTIDEAERAFSTLTEKWFSFSAATSASRIAFGMILDIPVKSREDAYVKLDELLHDVKVGRNTSDFLYQINRRRERDFNGNKILINRLSKWSANLQFQSRFNVKVTELEPPSHKAFSTNSLMTCHLEIDVNTVEEPSIQFAREFQKEIFAQLVDMANEIAEKGDIP